MKKQAKEATTLPNLFTRKQCSEYFGISMTTLHYWKINGILKPVAVGGRVYYRLRDMLAAIVDLE